MSQYVGGCPYICLCNSQGQRSNSCSVMLNKASLFFSLICYMKLLQLSTESWNTLVLPALITPLQCSHQICLSKVINLRLLFHVIVLPTFCMELLAAVKLLMPFRVGNNMIPFHLETAMQVLMFWGNTGWVFFSSLLFPKENHSLVSALKRELGILFSVPVLLNSLSSVLTACGCGTKDIYIQNLCITT